mgnify:CR=1 FL=1
MQGIAVPLRAVCFEQSSADRPRHRPPLLLFVPDVWWGQTKWLHLRVGFELRSKPDKPFPSSHNSLWKKKDPRAWKVLKSEYLYRRPWLTARRDTVQLPNGVVNDEYYILEFPDWVNVIARTTDGDFIFIRQYRPGLRRTCYEIVAGVIDPTDASPEPPHGANSTRRRDIRAAHGAKSVSSRATRAT